MGARTDAKSSVRSVGFRATREKSREARASDAWAEAENQSAVTTCDWLANQVAGVPKNSDRFAKKPRPLQLEPSPTSKHRRWQPIAPSIRLRPRPKLREARPPCWRGLACARRAHSPARKMAPSAFPRCVASLLHVGGRGMITSTRTATTQLHSHHRFLQFEVPLGCIKS